MIPSISDLQTYGIRGNRTHPAAVAYRSALVAAGTSPTYAHMAALSAFFRAGDVQGWRSALACLYLPVWGAAAPNALCAVTLASGSFIGPMDYTGKQMLGSGGYFTTGRTPAALGLTLQGCGAAIGYPAQQTAFAIDSGARGTASVDDLIFYYNGTQVSLNLGSLFYAATTAARAGLWHFNSSPGAVTYGVTTATQETGTMGTSTAGSLPAVPIFVGAFNNNGVVSSISNRAVTCYAAWRSISPAASNLLAQSLWSLLGPLRQS